MLELHTTDEFADWYSTLADADAEEVAIALEVVEKLGPQVPSPASREAVLWYRDAASEVAFVSDEVLDLKLSIMRLLNRLESSAVQAQLAELPPEQSARASRALASAQHWIRRARVSTALTDAPELGRALSEVQRVSSGLLELIGSLEPPAPAHSQALRELNLRNRQPGMRILYGVDAPRARALLVLGEHLDRNAYGPSVRRALAAWQRYLSDENALEPGDNTGVRSL